MKKQTTTLEKYRNPKKRLEYLNNYSKENYRVFLIKLHKVKDKKIIDYFDRSKNKVEALRKLF